MDLGLKGQFAVVTGVSRGIGKAIALALAQEGISIAGISQSLNSAESIRSEVEALGVSYVAAGVNVASSADVSRITSLILKNFGSVDILINNAGITRDKELSRMTEEDWDSVLDVNLKGAWNFIHALAPSMQQRRKGSIVNISSVSGLAGNFGQTNYAASKAGMIGLTKAAAREFAYKRLRVNVVCPGWIKTDMSEVLSENSKRKVREAIPMKRLGTPEEVAGITVFLCSRQASYITGAVYTVSGGMA